MVFMTKIGVFYKLKNFLDNRAFLCYDSFVGIELGGLPMRTAFYSLCLINHGDFANKINLLLFNGGHYVRASL